MPARARSLEAAAAERFVGDRSFTPVARRRVGVELEWLVVARDDPTRPVGLDAIRAAAERAMPLPGGSRVTFEPGGQLELSSPPGTLPEAIAFAALDTAAVRAACESADLALVGLGLDPARPRRRAVDTPRYAAMEAFFDDDGPEGRTMMCATAALQVNLDVGRVAEVETRWRRAHALGPVLVAAFANSPIAAGRPTGWRSTRLAIWSGIDRGRTAPVVGDERDCASAWARYVLDARVMLIRVDDAHTVPVLEPLTFRQWIERGHDLGWPTVDDLQYHLSTLFPPVRPRGWLELRMIDALPEPWWRVAVAVTTALLDDERAARAVDELVAPVAGRWETAARDGLSDPDLSSAARGCFDHAIEALPRLGATRSTLDAMHAFVERYVDAGRCPADDRIEEWAADGRLYPCELEAPAWS